MHDCVIDDCVAASRVETKRPGAPASTRIQFILYTVQKSLFRCVARAVTELARLVHMFTYFVSIT